MIAALVTGAATVVAWIVVRHAARARGIALGGWPVLSLACAAAVGAVARLHGDLTLATTIVLAAVSVAAVTDHRCGAIFDRLTFALVAAGLIVHTLDGACAAALTGGVTAGGILAALYALTRGRGIGLGDVKLAAGIGAGVGSSVALASLAAAFVAGGAYAMWLLASGHAKRGAHIRFGPFLAAGTYAAVLAPGIVG
jgi:leader peptidase (prepilin peptidase)/N-methyltransferase